MIISDGPSLFAVSLPLRFSLYLPAAASTIFVSSMRELNISLQTPTEDYRQNRRERESARIIGFPFKVYPRSSVSIFAVQNENFEDTRSFLKMRTRGIETNRCRHTVTIDVNRQRPRTAQSRSQNSHTIGHF